MRKVNENLENLLIQKKKIYEIAEEQAKEITETIAKNTLLKQKLQDEISEESIKLFKESGEKKFFGGISVKEYDILKYSDEVAESWCKEHDMFFKWDKKSFEKSVKSLNLDFVKVEKEPKTTFPKEIKLEG